MTQPLIILSSAAHRWHAVTLAGVTGDTLHIVVDTCMHMC